MKGIKYPITRKLRLFIFWIANCLLFTINSEAQLYPFNAQLSVAPPYSLFLPDYGVGSNIMLNLIQRDINQTGGEAYLNIELEGGGIRLRTLPSFRPSSDVDLISGNMLTLSNSDLAEYFNVNNLSFEGISKEAFVTNGQQLPEGFYKLKIKAFFKFTGVQASNEAMSIMSLQKGQPPFINTPFENAKVSENPMQNFNINWTNRNNASLNQGNLPAYHLQMWELLEPTQDPNIIVNSNYPPILDEFTNFLTYQYGPSNTPLTAGKTYVIRVQIVDPEGRDVYTNGGFSQVRKFTYGDACNPPTNLTATLDTRGIVANWALTPNQGGYRIQYGRIDTAWTDSDVLINRYSIANTYPSAQYQMRVATVCAAGKQSEYSDIVYISTTPSGPKNGAACGDPFPKIEIKSSKLLPTLNVGDKFTSFDFDITVTKVTRNDSNSYAGEGKTPFMMLGGADVVVYFDGITINTDHQMFGPNSKVKFQQKPYVFSDKDLKQFKDDFKDTKEMATGNDAANPETVNVDVTIGTVNYDSTKKQIAVCDRGGNVIKTLSPSKDYKITDKDGNVYLVSKDNKITKQAKATETAVKNGGPADGGVNTDLYFGENSTLIGFSAHPQQILGFDTKALNSWGSSSYEYVRTYEGQYDVAYKAVPAAGTDKVIAKLQENPKGIQLNRIKFKTNGGQAVPFAYDSLQQQWTLTITGALHRQDFSVFPYYGNGKDTLCGKLNVMPFDHKEVNMVLVPLNGYKTAPKPSDLEAYLNKIYLQANIQYKVTLDKSFSSAAADLPLSVEHGKLEGEYSVNQAQVIVDYQVAHPENDNTIYVFLCKEGSNSAVKGHTPVNRSYGFLFGESIDSRTIAHEVGHGYPLALEHPFSEGGATGIYTSLMDYSTGTNLSFKQWCFAHNPKLKVRFGQSSEQGEIRVLTSSEMDALKSLMDPATQVITFISPANKPISFKFNMLKSIGFSLDDETSKGMQLSNGSLQTFTLIDDTFFKALYRGNEFIGYRTSSKANDNYIDNVTLQQINKKICIANPVITKGKIAFMVRKVDWSLFGLGWPSKPHDATGDLVGSLKSNVYFNDTKDNNTLPLVYDNSLKYNSEVSKYLSLHDGVHDERVVKALTRFSKYLYANTNAYLKYTDCNATVEAYSTSDDTPFYNYVKARYGGPFIYVDKFPEYFENYLYDIKVAIDNDKKAIKPPYGDWVKGLKTIVDKKRYNSNQQDSLTDHLSKVKCLDKNFRDIYKDFSNETRIEILKVLATDRMLGAWFGFANDAESYVANIIEHIKPENITSFLDKLESTDIIDNGSSKNIVAAIISKSQLQDYTNIMLSFTNLAQGCTKRGSEVFAPEKTMDRAINWNNDKEMDDGGIRVQQGVFKDHISIDNKGNITIKRQRKISWESQGIPRPAGARTDYSWEPIKPDLILKPFDLVWLVNDLKLDDDDLNVIGGQMAVVPAIALYYANDKLWNKNVMSTGQFIIDLATVLRSGKTMFMAKYGVNCTRVLTYGQKAWLSYEILVSSSNMVISINELEYNKDFKEAVTIFKFVTDAIDYSEKGTAFLKDRKVILGKILKTGKNIKGISKNGLIACLIAYNKLRTGLKTSRTVLKTAEARQFMSNYEGFIDECKKNWKDWYGVDFPINFKRGYFTDVDEFADYLGWDASLTSTFKNEVKSNITLKDLFAEANNTEWDQYAEAWKVLSADKALRTDLDGLNKVLKYLRETPNAKTDDLIGSFASALNKRAWLNGLGAVQEFADDVEGFVFTLGRSEDLTNLKSWLGKVDDGKVYLAVHGSGGEFLVLHNGNTITLSHRSLARWIAENKNIAKNAEIVLLSCADGTAAQNIANKLKGDYKITSWDGKVKVYDNGHIEGFGDCYSYKVSNTNSLNREKVTNVPKGVNNSSVGNKFVTLGSESGSEVLAFSKINRDNYIKYFADITDLRTASNCNTNCTVVALSTAKRLKGDPILDASKFSKDFVGTGENGLDILKGYVDLVPEVKTGTKPYLNPFSHRPSSTTSVPGNKTIVQRIMEGAPNNTSFIFASYVGNNSLKFNGHAFNVIKDENGIIKYFDVQLKDYEQFGEGIDALVGKMNAHGVANTSITSTWTIFDTSSFKQ